MAARTTTVFISNRTQAVRIPTEMRLPPDTKRVEIRARGRERIIAPAGLSWGSFFIDGPAVTDDFMADRATQAQRAREGL
jgi:antitoxin VapB